MIRTIISIKFQFLSYNLVQIYKPSKNFFSVLKSNCATLCFNHNSNLLFANHWKQQKLIQSISQVSFFAKRLCLKNYSALVLWSLGACWSKMKLVGSAFLKTGEKQKNRSVLYLKQTWEIFGKYQFKNLIIFYFEVSNFVPECTKYTIIFAENILRIFEIQKKIWYLDNFDITSISISFTIFSKIKIP